MGETSKLLALYRIDQQLNGLKGRLRAAEAYLRKQDELLGELDARKRALESQKKQLEASVHNNEVEASSYDERIETLRERMNTAATSREHSALLTEMNTIKADKGLLEEKALESLQALDEIKEQFEAIAKDHEERVGVRGVAKADRDEREAEIKDRVAELETERAKREAEVPPGALAVYQELRDLGVDDVMAPIEEQDRRNKEYSCGACFTHLPVEQLSTLLNRGDLVRCSSCDVILYIEDELRDSITTAAEKKRKRREVELNK